MRRILVIDDEPIRCSGMVKTDNISIAHGKDQIEFWLKKSAVRQDLIIMDHDMPLMDGTEIVHKFSDELIAANCPIRIWTLNIARARYMQDYLLNFAKSWDIEANIFIKRNEGNFDAG